MSITRLIALTIAAAVCAATAASAESKQVMHRRHVAHHHAQQQSQPANYSGRPWALPQGWPNPQG